MAHPLYAPRVNNNDDTVKVVGISISPGDLVHPGDVVAEVETDKSVAEVETDREGYVLKVLCDVDDQIEVGTVLMWVGETPDEPVPETPSARTGRPAAGAVREPTAKARAMLQELGLDAAGIPAVGDRLTVSDIEAHLAGGGTPAPLSASPRPTAARPEIRMPEVPGALQDLSLEEHGMLRTVLWHRDQAVAAYLEMEYDHSAWETFAAAYAERHKLMLSPLLPLLAYRLVEIARKTPKINATLVGERRYQYDSVNLGFTVQAGDTLYLTVVRGADQLTAQAFIERMGEIQRQAIGHKLKASESQGATVAFSSMSRWGVTRHVPVLPPNTSLMVAHAASKDGGRAVVGASYDHRVLSGYDVVRVLQGLSRPPEPGEWT